MKKAARWLGNRIVFTSQITRFLLVAFLLTTCNMIASAQTIHQPVGNPDWEARYTPFRMVANLYYVGTRDLAAYLIVTDKGNILINTGLASSLSQIKSNIKELGFDYKDIKILLTNQVHYDHVGAMASIKKETGAKFFVNAADAEVLTSGGQTDYELAHLGMSFIPVQPDRLLKDKDNIRLGNISIQMLHHPGHTKGSCSYLLNLKENHKVYRVLIANIPTIVTDSKFSEVKEYPDIQNDYAYTFRAMKKLSFDIWLAAHAGQFHLLQIRKEGVAYNPKLFMNKQAYLNQLNKSESVFEQKKGLK